MQNEGYPTFLAYGAITDKAHVKLRSGTTTNPPEVTLAGSGEYGVGVAQFAVADGEMVTVKLWNDSGTFEIMAGGVISEGALVYGAASGLVSASAVGNALGFAKQAASGSGSIIEVVAYPHLATTAATVSIADSGSLITGSTVEAALAEIMVGVKTAQYTINPDKILLESGADVGAFANGSTDGWTQLSSKAAALRWNNGGTPTDLMASYVLPQDLDDTAAVVVHFMGAIVKAGGSEADSPVFTVEAYFETVGAAPAADTDCGGESGEFLTASGAVWQEKTLSLAAADVPAAPTVLTLVFHPKDGELGTDDFVLLPPWLEVTRKCLTS
jgi:hypothetical protein